MIRRSVVRGRAGRTRRWRWRGPAWLGEIGQLLQLGELAEIPVVGIVVMAVLLPVLAVFLAVLLPVLALAVVEAMALALLVAAGVVAATLFGRPILVRARPADGGEPVLVWAVKGWAASRSLRDAVAEACRRGQPPETIGVPGSTFLSYDPPAAGVEP